MTNWIAFLFQAYQSAASSRNSKEFILVNAKHCGASLRKRHRLQSSHTQRRRSSLSVVESECEALVFYEVGAITAEELVARIQSNQRRGPERLECHNDRVYCVCARLQTVPQSIAFPVPFTWTNLPFVNCHWWGTPPWGREPPNWLFEACPAISTVGVARLQSQVAAMLVDIQMQLLYYS